MLKTILVHLTGAPCDEPVLAAAMKLAKPFDAHLDCLHFRATLGVLVSEAIGPEIDEDTFVLSDRFEVLRKSAKEKAHRAHQAFTAFVKREGVPIAASPPAAQRVTAAWHDKTGPDIGHLAREARFRDLVVVAGGGTEGSLPARELGDLLLGAGRPIVLANAKPSTEPIRTIAVAWKDTAESARAITAAMPLLSKAERIVLLSANEENEKAMECIDCAESVVGHLRWHGFRAEGRYVIPAGRSFPDAVLESAREAGADLLVMGAYGRSRFTETVFGGFTRRMFLGTGLPVFMFH